MTCELDNKISSLNYCLDTEAYEDAAGHLCDLLEFCRQRTRTSAGTCFMDLHAMIAKYGVNPKRIAESGSRKPK